MKVNNISTVNNLQPIKKEPSFSANYYEKLNRIIPNTKVFKNLRVIDASAFQAYVSSKSYKIGVTADEVAALEKFDKEEFIQKSYEFLMNKMGLKNSICPPIAPAKFQEFDMGYSFLENVIYYNVDKVNVLSKGKLFSALRHEMQHMNQNYMVLRHEKFGPLAIDAYTKRFIFENKKGFKDLLKVHSIDELEKIFSQIDSPNAQFSLEVLKSLKNGDVERYNGLFDMYGDIYKQSLMQLREKIINNFGVINNDSALTPKVEKYFNEFKELGYYDAEGKIDYNKYLDSFIESDAIAAQIRAKFEFSQEPCFMKFMKDDIYKTIQESEFNKIMQSIK